MTGDQPGGVRAVGTLATYDRWHFRPSEWLAWMGYYLGLNRGGGR